MVRIPLVNVKRNGALLLLRALNVVVRPVTALIALVPLPINTALDVKVVAPVPPRFTGNVPVVILPVSRFGISAATNDLKEAAPDEPFGAAKTVFWVLLLGILAVTILPDALKDVNVPAAAVVPPMVVPFILPEVIFAFVKF